MESLPEDEKDLSEWSRNKVGDIFANTKALETKVDQLEAYYTTTMDQEDRMILNHAKAELVPPIQNVWYLRLQLEGHENNRFFHNIVKGRSCEILL